MTIVLEKGFNVRVGCADRTEAIRTFGVPGNNVDIIQLFGGSAGMDFESERVKKRYADALEEVQAIVLCPAISPVADLLFSESSKVAKNFAIVKRLLGVAALAKQAKVTKVQKIALVSRNCLPDNVPQSQYSQPNRNLVSALLEGVADSALFSKFQQAHRSVEAELMRSGYDYVIIRCPPLVGRISPQSKLY